MTQDPTQLDAATLSKLYGRGKLSPVETMKAVLRRTERVVHMNKGVLQEGSREALQLAASAFAH